MASNTKKIKLQSSEVKSEPQPVKQEVAERSSCAVDGADGKGYTPLHRIFTKSESPEQDEETMKMLVSLGADIHTTAKDGSGIFHSAVKYNIPAKLLESFVNLTNAKVPAKYIHQENGKYKAVKGEFSWDINAVDNEGFTPMHLVAMNRGDSNNNKALLKLLLRLGAKINSKTKNEKTVLHLAIVNNKAMEIVQELLAAGVNINSQTKDGSSALFLAVKENRPIGIIEALLKGVCEVDLKTRDGFTALHLAINNSRSNDNIVKALVQSRADVNLKTSDDSTGLHLAVKNMRSEAVTGDIINAGANLEAVDVAGKTALHYTYKYTIENRTNFIKTSKKDVKLHPGFLCVSLSMLLVKSGARFDVLDDFKCTPLLAAAICQKTGLVLAMMDAAKGDDINLEAVHKAFERYIVTIPRCESYNDLSVVHVGCTALLVSVINYDISMVEALIKGGASINSLTPQNKNALHIIIEGRYSHDDTISIAKLLIDNGIDRDAKYCGETPLHMALCNSEEITKYLIQKGANVNIKNEQQETVLHCAIQNNEHEIIKLLLKQ